MGDTPLTRWRLWFLVAPNRAAPRQFGGGAKTRGVSGIRQLLMRVNLRGGGQDRTGRWWSEKISPGGTRRK